MYHSVATSLLTVQCLYCCSILVSWICTLMFTRQFSQRERDSKYNLLKTWLPHRYTAVDYKVHPDHSSALEELACVQDSRKRVEHTKLLRSIFVPFNQIWLLPMFLIIQYCILHASWATSGLFLVKKGWCLSCWSVLGVTLCDGLECEEYGAPGSRALLVAAWAWTNSGGVESSPSRDD